MAGEQIHGKWVPEGPFYMSHGDYKLSTGQTIYFGQPFAPDLDGSDIQKDTNDQNKIWVKAYDDVTSVERCYGVAIVHKFARGTTGEDYEAGKNTRRRDVNILGEGYIDMIYKIGISYNIGYKGMQVAPYPGGFREWNSGMYLLGTLIEDNVYTGQAGKVRVMPREPEAWRF